jgi:hypothetical protein
MAVWIGYLKSAQSIVQIQGHRHFDSRQMHRGWQSTPSPVLRKSFSINIVGIELHPQTKSLVL